MARIEPRTLKGFRDYLPEAMIPREALIETARRVYRSYGFVPIDTPALEYAEILTGKGGEESDKQLYRFLDHGGRDVALRFDLTVPLARFVAQHANELGLPFKRYHVGPVWRGENTQRGRYREFLQCDFDTIGSESLVSDVEMVLVIHDLMRAIGFEAFVIRVNNRKLLNGVLQKLEVGDRAPAVLRAVDKLGKLDRAAVEAEIVREAGTSAEQARLVLEFATLRSSSGGEQERVLEVLEPHVRGNELAELGLDELHQVVGGARDAGVSAGHVRVDVSIARGLDYYTGTVVETSLTDPEGASIGSVCSGGRYDDLASLYTAQRLPGVGASLGLDRLLTAMEELGLVARRGSTAPVFLAYFEAARLGDYLRLASDLRATGLGVELYPEPRKLGAQLKYADRRGFPLALVVGESEWAANRAQVKDLGSGASASVPLRGADGGPSPELLAALAPR